MMPSGYAIMTADDPDTIDKLLASHPFLSVPGNTVGVYHIMEM